MAKPGKACPGWSGEKPHEKPRPSLRSNDLETREVGAVARRIAGEQDQVCDRGVGADVEVRQRRPATPASSAVSDEALPSEECRLPRQGKAQEIFLREGFLELLDPIEPDRDFGVDERIDREGGALSAFGEGLLRPGGPFRVFGENVEQDVAVDEDGQRSPRVSARIWSVVIRTDPRPRSRWTIDFPRRPASRARRSFRTRTVCPTTSNSTSELGSSPSFSRISTGMVTCPFVVIFIVLPRQVILAAKRSAARRSIGDAGEEASVEIRLALLRKVRSTETESTALGEAADGSWSLENCCVRTGDDDIRLPEHEQRGSDP